MEFLKLSEDVIIESMALVGFNTKKEKLPINVSLLDLKIYKI
jgi:hypothetical protein